MKNAKIVCMMNPVTRERVQSEIPAGSRLSDHISIPEGAVMECNGQPYSDEPLSGGDVLNLIMPPMGGEQGKSAARTALVIAAMLVTKNFAMSWGGYSMFLSSGNSLTMLGSFVVAAAGIGAGPLIPPKEAR